MKRKYFILTLLMTFCSIMFGQEPYYKVNVDAGEYENNMPLIAKVSFDGAVQSSDQLEVGVFCGDQVRASFFTNYKLGNDYCVFNTIWGNIGEVLTFKVYDHRTKTEWYYNQEITVNGSKKTSLLFDILGYGTFGSPAVINFNTAPYYIPNTDAEASMLMAALVKIDGVEQANANLELGAFINDIVRGSAKVNYNVNGKMYAYMQVYGEPGQEITFKLYDHSAKKEIEFIKVNSITFNADGNVNFSNPEIINFIVSPIEVKFADATVQYFKTMEEAVPYNNANEYEGATITLYDDVTDKGIRFWENNMTFDLNKFEYTIDQAVGSPGTESQGFQIRPEVTGNVTIKNGTITIAENTNVKWLFNSYAADFVVEDVVLNCENIVTGTNQDYLLVVQNEGDKATFTDVTINGYDAKNVMLGGGAYFTAPEGFNVDVPAGYRLVYENGTYSTQRLSATFKREGKPQGAYANIVGTEGTDSYREHFSINLYDVYASESLVVKVYHNDDLLLTTTYRDYDLDDSNKENPRYPVSADALTVNNVVYGKLAGSWNNEWHIEPNVANLPNKFEVYVDGTLTDTYVPAEEHQYAGFRDKAEMNDYLSFTGVYKQASITRGEDVTYYMTFDEAYAASESNDVITVFDPVVVTENKTYDFTGKTITGENVYPIFRIQNDAKVTVNGEGSITNNDYVFVLGASDGSSDGNLTINGGLYTGTVTAVSVTKGELSITDGEFKVNDSEYGSTYLINCIDANYNNGSAEVSISGGTFHSWDPENNAAEGAGTNFCAAGYISDYDSEKDVYTVREGVYVVRNITTGQGYESLRAAVDEAQAGETIQLLQNITLEGGYEDAAEGLRITLPGNDENGNGLTIDGAGHTIDCGTFLKGIRVYNNIVSQKPIINFNNLTVVNNTTNGHCINTRSGDINLKINNTNLIATNGNTQPLTIGGEKEIHRVTLGNNTKIDAGKSGYGIICFVSTNVDVITSGNVEINGYAAFYVKGEAIDVELHLGQGVYTGTNTHSGESNNFGTLVLEGDNATVKMYGTNPTIKAVAEGTASQAAFLVRGENNQIIMESLTAKVETEGENAYWAMIDSEVAATTTITKYIDETNSVQLLPAAEARGVQFMSLEEAIRYANAEETVLVVNDNTVEEAIVVEKDLTIDLNGKVITAQNIYPVIRIQNDANVTVKGEGSITNNDYVFVLGASDGTSSGNLTINGGSYTGTVTAVSVTKGELSITDGEFKVNDSEYGSTYLINCIDANYNNGSAKVSISGGTFHGFNPESNAAEQNAPKNFCAEGYIAVYDATNDTYTVKQGEYVAQIGETQYESLQEAIDAAQDGDEIVVIKDITLGYEDATQTFGGSNKTFFNVAGKTVTIDLNGMIVKAILEGEETVKAVISVENEAKLTLEDSSENGTGTVEVDSESGVSTLLCNNGGYLTVEGGNYILEKGLADGSGSGGLVYSSTDETVTINEGEFVLGNVGTSTNGSPWIFNASSQNTRNIIVNGGTFNADILHQYYPFEVKAPKERALQNNGDGTYTMVDAVAYVDEQHKSGIYYTNEVGFVSLAEAVAAAGKYNQDGAYVTTVTMLQGVELTEGVVVEHDMKFNLNEKTIENAEGADFYPVIRIQNDADVTIYGNGAIENDDYVFVLGASDSSSAGNLTIENGAYKGTTTVASVTKGTLTINGAEFSISETDTYDYAYLINCIDANYNNGTATVAISGGTFHNWNPENNAAEGANTNFCANGYAAFETEANVWEVYPQQSMVLHEGWNWFSSYIDIDGEEGLETLQDALAGNATIIKGQTAFTSYSSNLGTWNGGLTSTSNKEMYMIDMNDVYSLSLTGDMLDPSTIEYELNKGWNWISYPISEAYAVKDVVKGDDVLGNNDQVKSHNDGFAEYYNGNWYGSLKTLTPGQGYMYGNIEGLHQFKYAVPTRDAKSELRANITAENNRWVPATSQFVNNMTMVAMVEGVNADNYEVAAFVNGEVRGSARPIYIEPLDAYMLFLTIYGNDVEEMTFSYYDLTTGEEYELNDRINYADDAKVGSIAEPYIFNRGTTGIGENSLSEINIYPNPTTTGSEINLEATCEIVEVYNALGVKIAEYHNVDTIDALETAGIYVIRITNNGNVQNCRLVIK